MARQLLVPSLLASLLAALPLAAQEPAAPAEEETFFESIDVEVVNLEVFVTDRQGMGYAFVVGSGDVNGFTADMDDINRTLDLVA